MRLQNSMLRRSDPNDDHAPAAGNGLTLFPVKSSSKKRAMSPPSTVKMKSVNKWIAMNILPEKKEKEKKKAPKDALARG